MGLLGRAPPTWDGAEADGEGCWRQRAVRHDAQPGHACHERHVPQGQAQRAVGATLYFPAVADGNAGLYPLYPLVIYYSIFTLQLFIVTSSCASRTFIYTQRGGRRRDEKRQQELLVFSSEEKGKGRPWGSCAKGAESSGQADLRAMNTPSSRMGGAGEGVSDPSLRSGGGPQASP